MANFSSTTLCTAQTGNFTSTAAAATSSMEGQAGAGAVVITSTVGATPTVTVNIQGSVDGVTWSNVPYYAGAFVVAPTYILTAIVITTATTTQYLLQPGTQWQYIQIVASANTNVTLTATAYL